jgi:M6 family metalloprotease-like protein
MLEAARAAKLAQSRTTGTRRALVLFARFKGEPADPVPTWAADIFDPDLPGSFSHFYDTMSFGKLQGRGAVAPRVYESSQEAVAYLSADPTQPGRFGEFTLEILRQADHGLDFSRFDNDGPDGVPNSGDDDRVVDAVFIVLGMAPRNFLVGSATGIAELGFEEDFATSEQSASGALIRIAPSQGTLQQGRYFAEAMGAMCHEYGHVLGLPDLYNTEFLSKQGAGPEEDSAGVGAWCLMGWGALGWNGSDGPNSFCAWSRVQLGWSQVVEIAQPREEMRSPAVGSAGQVYQVPVDRGDFFLLEYRTRTGTYYDRNIPGEGVLVWHIGRTGDTIPRWRVDLECADGRWADAGYPLGRRADPLHGGDNLDFWAHDEGFTRAHNGNLGDATDPFAGAQFRAFTPQTNPSSHSLAGTRSVRIEAIRLEAGLALAQVELDSLRLEIEEVRLRDPDGNGILSPGETADLLFWLYNRGGFAVPGVRTVLSGADPVVHIDRPETRFGEVDLGLRFRPGPGKAFPQLSLRGDPGGARMVPLVLEVFAGETRLARQEFSLQTASAFTWSGRVRDEEGNGVGGIMISIRSERGSSYSVTTAKDGAFQIDLLRGSYSAYMYVSSDESNHSRFVELSADLYSEWVLPTTYAVVGTIRGPRGQPLD